MSQLQIKVTRASNGLLGVQNNRIIKTFTQPSAISTFGWKIDVRTKSSIINQKIYWIVYRVPSGSPVQSLQIADGDLLVADASVAVAYGQFLLSSLYLEATTLEEMQISNANMSERDHVMSNMRFNSGDHLYLSFLGEDVLGMFDFDMTSALVWHTS